MIAVLVFAHKNFDQVRRLVDSLKHEDVDIFMHVDKKAEFDSKLFEDINVFEKRFDITWGNIDNVKLNAVMVCLKTPIV